MKRILLTGLMSMTVAGMALAAPAADIELQAKSMTDQIMFKNVKNHKQTDAKVLAPGVTITTIGGVKKLNAPRLMDKARKLVKRHAPMKAAATLPDGQVLFESFEGWNKTDLAWTPEGWTVDMKGQVERAESWTIAFKESAGLTPADGDYYYGINYSEQQQDEWLISPLVEVSENMNLSYWLYLDPLYLYNIDNVDWDAGTFVGEKIVAATLQVWVQPEGAEWEMIHDYADDYKDMTSVSEFYEISPMGLELKTENLSAYVGKKVKVAFRYVGVDGNTMYIDAIAIGYPQLEGVSYMDPFSTLYWGMKRGTSLEGFTPSIAQHPVFAPLTWTNMSYIEGAEFSWEYSDPTTGETVTGDNPDELTVTYLPDYSSPERMKNNFYTPPVLRATAPNSIPAEFSSQDVYFQAGGKSVHSLDDGSELEVSMFPFSFQNKGLMMLTVDDQEIGDYALPVFGHNENTDKYWLNYSLNGEQAEEGMYSKLEGIGNIFLASEAPLVVNGLTVFGYGKVAADAEFTATIYALDAEMSADISTFTKIATAKIKGSDVLCDDPESTYYLTFPFDFAEPVVVKATEEHPAYVFMFEGFNSDKVEYFAPLQSKIPDPNYMCLGYILNHIDLGNYTERGEYYSFKPMVYKENGEYVDPYGAFAIGIEGEYPWLTTDCEIINITSDGVVTSVPLGSYYDGSKLTVEVPEGAEASVEGRYNECVLKVWHDDSAVVVTGNVVVKGPGVELTIPVDQRESGVSAIEAGDAEIEGIYDLGGNRLKAATKGINIIKYNDGTVRKQVVK